MCKSIYKRLIEDFNFLNCYGYSYSHPLKHFEIPSVVYSRNESELEIGFNYRTDRFYIYEYIKKDYLHPILILDDSELSRKSYYAELDSAKKELIAYLIEKGEQG